MMMPLKKHSKIFFFLIGIFLVLIVELGDILTGYEIPFSIFYLLVSLYFAWFFGLWPGITAAVILGILSVLTDLFAGATYAHISIPFWTVIMRATMFSFAVFILLALRQRERELKKTILELEQTNKELDNFTAMVSHDVQTPLSTIAVLCQLMETKLTSGTGDAKEYLTHIKGSVKRMQQLTKDLLSYAKAARISRSIAFFRQVALRDVMDEVLKDLHAFIEQKNAKITIGELPSVKADPLQMRQLFQNLIGNALKFSKETEPPEIRIDGRAGTNFVEIHVQDNGIGFEQSDVERIFKPFERLHHDFEGTGIGLATCLRIIQEHGGQITAQSKPGEGSVFIVSLPAA